MTHLASCIDAIDNLSCDQLRAAPAAIPECASPGGTLADDTACEDDSQCKSTHCTGQIGVCGTCRPFLQEGADCTSDTAGCASPLQCVQSDPQSATSRCAKSATEGGDCSSASCGPNFYCSADQKCAKVGASGSACADGNACQYLDALVCNGGKCGAAPVVSSGEPCDTGTVCSPGNYCKFGSDDAGPTPTGSCTRRAKDGEACDSASRSDTGCFSPAQCLSNSCTIPAISGCK